MKKFLWVAAALVIVFTACSSTPKPNSLADHIVGENYELTRMEELWEGETFTEFSRYLEVSEKEIVEWSSLIAKVEIVGEPIEYAVNCNELKGQMAQVYKAQIIKIYKSDDAELKEGDMIYIARRDYSSDEYSDKKYCSAEYIKTTPKNTYVLFLNTLKNEQEKENMLAKEAEGEPYYYYAAMDEVADYMIVDDFRAIIYCFENNYEFSMNYTTLGQNAESKLNTITNGSSFMHYFVTDDNFDEDVQAMVNKYK